MRPAVPAPPAKPRRAKATRLGHVRNLAGMKSGTLTAVKYVQTQRQGADEALSMAMWECRCESCGSIVRRQRRYIVAGTARCDCQRKIRIDLTGKSFGRLKVLGPAPKRGGESWWLVRCECGGERELRRSYLTTGDTRSCGCLRKETTAKNQAKAARARRAAKRRAARAR